MLLLILSICTVALLAYQMRDQGAFIFQLLASLLFAGAVGCALQHLLILNLQHANEILLAVAAAFTAAPTLARLAPHGITHRRGALTAGAILFFCMVSEVPVILANCPRGARVFPFVELGIFSAISVLCLYLLSRKGIRAHRGNVLLLLGGFVEVCSVGALGDKVALPLSLAFGLLILLSISREQENSLLSGVLLMALAALGIVNLVPAFRADIFLYYSLIAVSCFVACGGWKGSSRLDKVAACLVFLGLITAFILSQTGLAIKIWYTLPVHLCNAAALLIYSVGDGFYQMQSVKKEPKPEPITILGEEFEIAVDSPTQDTSGSIRIQGKIPVLGIDIAPLKALVEVCSKRSPEISVMYLDWERAFIIFSVTVLPPGSSKETCDSELERTVDECKKQIRLIRSEYEAVRRCADAGKDGPVEDRIYRRRFIFDRNDLNELLGKAEHERGKSCSARLAAARLLSAGAHVYDPESCRFENEVDLRKALGFYMSAWHDGSQEGCVGQMKIRHAMGKVTAEDCERVFDSLTDELSKAQAEAFLSLISQAGS